MSGLNAEVPFHLQAKNEASVRHADVLSPIFSERIQYVCTVEVDNMLVIKYF